MSFRENLIHLRAANNMTQEQLAMMLGVSRQSVTKWEAEKSSPEMDKLLKMCQIFDCTLDDLVQGDLTGKEASPSTRIGSGGRPADVFGYDEHMNRFADRISSGCIAPLLGVAIGIIFLQMAPSAQSGFAILPENLANALGLLCIFASIGVCLAFIVPAAMEHAQFVRTHPFIEDFYTEEQRARMRKTFTYELIGGVFCIFLGVCAIIVLDGTAYQEIIGVPVMMLLIALGVRFIVHGGMLLAKANIANYNTAASEVMTAHEIAAAPIPEAQKEELLGAHRQDKRIGALCGTIMIIATIAGLVMLFVPAYHNSLFWLAWPIGGLLCGIVSILMKGFASPQE